MGSFANDFLSAAQYTSINIQVQYMPGFAQASTDITAFLNEFINKPGGINIILHTTQTTVMSGILISGPVPQ